MTQFTDMPTPEIVERRRKMRKWYFGRMENASKRKGEIIDTCFPIVEKQDTAYKDFAEELERLSKSRQGRA